MSTALCLTGSAYSKLDIINTVNADMAHSASFTHRQSPAVERKRSWSLMLLSCVIGAAVSLGTILAIGAFVDTGAITFVLGTAAAGVVWGIATKVINQLIGSETTSVVLHSYSIQQSYRETIQQHLGAVLEAVMTSIRTNSPLELKDSVYFDVCDDYRFEKKERRTYFSYSFKVTPPPGTPRRPLDKSIPPLDLPMYEPSSTHTTEDKKDVTVKGLFDTIGQGTVLGLTNGVSASLMFLLLGTAGVPLGVVFATMLVKHFAPPKSPDKAALGEEFQKELRCHLNRLMYCAKDNNIGLDADVCAASTSGVTRTWVGRSNVNVKQVAQVHRRLSARLVWPGEVADGVMRSGKERKSVAEGLTSDN